MQKNHFSKQGHQNFQVWHKGQYFHIIPKDIQVFIFI